MRGLRITLYERNRYMRSGQAEKTVRIAVIEKLKRLGAKCQFTVGRKY